MVAARGTAISMIGAGMRAALSSQAPHRVDQVASGRSATWTASTAPVTDLDLGHASGGSVLAGLVLSASVKAREPKV